MIRATTARLPIELRCTAHSGVVRELDGWSARRECVLEAGHDLTDDPIPHRWAWIEQPTVDIDEEIW